MDTGPADDAPAVSRRSPLRQWLAERRISQLWKAGVAAILAVAALFGGLDTVDDKATPFAPGEDFSDGQFTLSVARASLVPSVQGGGRVIGPPKPGHRYLGVVATVRNDGTSPGRLRNELDVRNLSAKEFYGVFRYRDGSPIPALGPGLTEQLVFAWLVPDDAVAVGDTITVRVWKKNYRQLMVTYGGKEWLDSLTDYGVTELTVGGPS
ncbi:hypothetical protein ACNUDN_13830 [Mycobacterium sp. smrl_JER01]|uniref:hypothetical protein n=1 Tax=Mycobacterium sp. smrl_JER01 TaxID=3402633 RepID=UPI003AC4BCDF